MEKTDNIILSSDNDNKEVEFDFEDANNLDFIKSMIRDGVVQVKMPIKVKCKYDDLLVLNKYMYLKRDESQIEEYEKFHKDLFSVANEHKMVKFFSFTKCAHYLRAYPILELITTYLANEINICDNKDEICKKFKIPEILLEDK